MIGHVAAENQICIKPYISLIANDPYEFKSDSEIDDLKDRDYEISDSLSDSESDSNSFNDLATNNQETCLTTRKRILSSEVLKVKYFNYVFQNFILPFFREKNILKKSAASFVIKILIQRILLDTSKENTLLKMKSEIFLTYLKIVKKEEMLSVY